MKKLRFAFLMLCTGMIASCSPFGQEEYDNIETKAPVPTTQEQIGIIEKRIQDAKNPEKIDEQTIAQETESFINQPDPEAQQALPDPHLTTIQRLLEKLPNRHSQKSAEGTRIESPLNHDGTFSYDDAQQQKFERTKRQLLSLLNKSSDQGNAAIIREQLEKNRLFGEIYPEASQVNPNNLQREQLDVPTFNNEDFSNAAKEAAALLLKGKNLDSYAEQKKPPKPRKKRIALLAPFSGEHKKMGQSLLEAAQMAITQSKNKQISLLPIDTKGTEEGAVTATQRAIEYGASIIIGPVFSKNTKKVYQITKDTNITLFSLSNDQKLSNRGLYVFGYSPQEQIRRLFHFFKEKNIHNIGLFLPETSYGLFILQASQQIANDYGIKISAIGEYNYKSSNFSEPIITMSRFHERKEISLQGQRVIPPEYQAILLPEVDENNVRAIAAQLDYFDTAGPHVVLAGLEPWNNLHNLYQEKSLLGAIFVGLNRKTRNHFIQNYERLFKKAPHHLASIAFDTTALAIYALQQNSPVSQIVAKAKKGFEGADGILHIKNNGRVERGYTIYQFNENAIKAIDPIQ